MISPAMNPTVTASAAFVLPPEKAQANTALLGRLAGKYIWWMSPEDALKFPARIAAQVMNTGEFADVMTLSEALGDDVLRRVIGGAEAGWFDDRSWHFWHYRLNLAPVGQVPPLPVRRIG